MPAADNPVSVAASNKRRIKTPDPFIRLVAAATQPQRDPKYVAIDPAWDGLGHAMDSRAYPGKGYRGR